MAYDQRNQYPPRQQQQYDQRAPPRGGQKYNNQYNNQYDDNGYDQGQYQQWDDGYDQQQQGGGWGNGGMNNQMPPRQQQYHDGYDDGRGQMRQPPQGRRPNPRDQYGQEQYDDRMYQQPRGQAPRGRPMGPPHGGMQGGDSRGRGMGRPPNGGPGQQGLRPPGKERPLMSPVSPTNVPQDNAFPTFPSQQQQQRQKPRAGSMDEAMRLMSVGNDERGDARGPSAQSRGRGQGPQNRGPPGRGQGYGSPDFNRQDSGHFEGRGQGYGQQRPPPQRAYHDPSSPTERSFGPNTQRSMTMPQNRGQDARGQWPESGAAAGYHGPASPNAMPPRPSTAGGVRQNNPQFDQRRPPMPQVQQQQQYQDDGRGDLDTFYDDYYGDERKSKASIDMPDFDSIPQQNTRHQRGLSFEFTMSPTGQAPQGAQPEPAPASRDNFYQQASRSRSQPDLHGQNQPENDVYEVAGDAPPMPGVPRTNTSPPVNGIPSNPRGRGPQPRGLPNGMPGRGPPGQGYDGRQQQNFDPRYGRQPPPVQRGYSDESQWSDPGPRPGRNGPPMAGNPIQRPGTAAPLPGRMPSDPIPQRAGTAQPRPSNPDALPSHPTPVRAGLMQQSQPQQNQAPSPQNARPPPVRQYNSDPAAVPQRQPSRSKPHPVTHDELNRLRNEYKFENNNAKGLQLAKKLVEAASVLADEGGTADNRTRNKNREKFIFEGHKIIKKLVANGYAEAMFYLADCYGQGLLGLQVDNKEAFSLYQSAAKLGHAQSAYRTAMCCEMGNEEGGGTKKDPLKAVQWYRRAAALGDTPALYKMGIILLRGLLGQQKNLGEAINMLKRAAEKANEENPHALHELGLLFEAQTGNERIIRDEAYAFSLFQQAANLGYKFSQFRMAQAYEYGLMGCPIDARTSIAWYTRAAAQEEHQSELALSGWYLTGAQGILEQSDTEAYLWARKAACAEPPLPKALFAMGYFTEVGIGCPRSLEEAKRWYGRAATFKFPKAQERLEELKRGGAKVQKSRERLSRSNQKQHEENCVVM